MADRRNQARLRVMKTLARRVAWEPLPYKRDDGISPVVVALPEDTVGELASQVDEMQGRTNVVVAYPDRLKLFVAGDDEKRWFVDSAETEHLATVNGLVEWFESGRLSQKIFAVDKQRPKVRELDYAF